MTSSTLNVLTCRDCYAPETKELLKTYAERKAEHDAILAEIDKRYEDNRKHGRTPPVITDDIPSRRPSPPMEDALRAEYKARVIAEKIQPLAERDADARRRDLAKQIEAAHARATAEVVKLGYDKATAAGLASQHRTVTDLQAAMSDAVGTGMDGNLIRLQRLAHFFSSPA